VPALGGGTRHLIAKENAMDKTSHTQALTMKHASLDEQLRQELSRPSPDDATIKAIKQQKLRLKEQIAQT
jgi:hypothetical protein